MSRHSITLSPLTETVIAKVQQHLRGQHPYTKMTYGQALDWIIRDIEWCEPGLPAYGCWSPVLGHIIREALEEHGSVGVEEDD